ncbi:hypothetical protein CN200_31910 [Sinorhizobium meliloti]|nr:hypothetical protein CN200_31910 [Sinorhizobium meliloti]RVN80065.1 hypothetical protein CN107_29645 [Sinorhizobium meliloti]RVO00443.1 hypothetical protein CN103_29440 [Sinorhizobium meliloti]
MHPALILSDQRTKTCGRSKCYSDLCASDKTRGAVAHRRQTHRPEKAARIAPGGFIVSPGRADTLPFPLIPPRRDRSPCRRASAWRFPHRCPCVALQGSTRRGP